MLRVEIIAQCLSPCLCDNNYAKFTADHRHVPRENILQPSGDLLSCNHSCNILIFYHKQSTIQRKFPYIETIVIRGKCSSWLVPTYDGVVCINHTKQTRSSLRPLVNVQQISIFVDCEHDQRSGNMTLAIAEHRAELIV